MQLTEQQQQDGQQVLDRLISKCWGDQSFRKEVVASPQATIENFIGKPLNLPKGKELVVNDQTDDRYVYINIPSERNLEDIELTDEQLEAISGGLIPVGVAVFYIVGATAGGVAIGNGIGNLINAFR